LPIDAFDPYIGYEQPEELIDMYRDPNTATTMAWSKWNFANGETEQRLCEVIDYNEKTE
jgi:hypothetical protein